MSLSFPALLRQENLCAPHWVVWKSFLCHISPVTSAVLTVSAPNLTDSVRLIE